MNPIVTFGFIFKIYERRHQQKRQTILSTCKKCKNSNESEKNCRNKIAINFTNLTNIKTQLS